MKKIIAIFCLFIATHSVAFGQELYFVLFKDKANSEYSVSKPADFLAARSIERRAKQQIVITTHDFPPNKAYLSAINKVGKVVYSSRWFNGALVEVASNAVLAEILKLPFVKGLERKGDIRTTRLKQTENVTDKFEILQENDFGFAKNQNEILGIDKMHADGMKGKGILIGFLDSGFLNANKLSVFTKLVAENRIITTYDFVDREANVYNDHSHGTNVLGTVLANSSGILEGTAPEASVALFRTEDVFSETSLEEAYWLFAAERADSLGVDIISSSLGYYEFDEAAQNYTYQDMNGDKTIAARAADFAFSKGILVVVSAGNEGNNPWKYIATPADADSVLAIGAVDALKKYAPFSSVGPNAKGNVKPELVAQGAGVSVANTSNSVSTSNGTSFSAPMVAGLAAGVWQAKPQLTAKKLRESLIKSGSQYQNPTEFLGYGIPTYAKALEVLEFENILSIAENEAGFSVSPNPVFSMTDNLQINVDSFDDASHLKIYSSNGILVFQKKITSKSMIINDLTSLQAGVYFVSVSNSQQKMVRRIVKL